MADQKRFVNRLSLYGIYVLIKKKIGFENKKGTICMKAKKIKKSLIQMHRLRYWVHVNLNDQIDI